MALSKITNLSITDDAVRTVGIQDAAVTTAKTSGVPTLFLPNAAPLIINADCAVSQRGTSATGKTANGYYTCDRFKLNVSSLGTWTVTQETLSSGDAFADGFQKAFRIDCTTADASPGAADSLLINYSLEGQDVQCFKKGTANAKKMTLSFWVKSNKTGTAQVNIRDMDNTRMCSGSYAISVADTWEKKIINIAADTTGAFGMDNAESLRIQFWLDAGSNFTSGTMPTAWETTATADLSVYDLALGDNTANDWAITGVQMEVGEYTSSTIPPFQFESSGDNLARCQRYYNIFGNAANKPIGMAAFYSTTAAYVGPLTYPVEMRASPTITITGGSGDAEATAGYAINHSSSNDWFQTFQSSDSTTKCVFMYASSGISATDGDAGRGRTAGTEFGKVEAASEL